MAVGKCFTVETLTWEEYQEFVSKSDVFSQIFAGQVRIRLNVETEQGSTLSSCVFLRKGIGCSLPEDVRPHTCRLYPFWFERTLVKGKGSVPTSLTVNSNTFHSVCYGRVVAKSEANRLFGLFDTTEESLLSVAAKMLRDAYVHARLVKSRSSPIALVLE